MTEVIPVLKPHLVGEAAESRGKAVIGTVQGDFHDIGKNIVRMMLEGAGYEVVDLGVDVPADKFVETVRREAPQFVLMSALITLTMESMRRTIAALDAAGLRSAVKIGVHRGLKALAARDNGVFLMEAFMYRFHPRSRAIKALADSGALGDLRSVRAAFTFAMDAAALAAGDNARLRPEMGGGALLDVGCYGVSLIRDKAEAKGIELVVNLQGIPPVLRGKILFLSDRLGSEDGDLMVMDPDGGNVALWAAGRLLR